MQIPDTELATELNARETVIFVGGSVDWHDVERQVERLGFGDMYIVSASKGRLKSFPVVNVRPTPMAGEI